MRRREFQDRVVVLQTDMYRLALAITTDSRLSADAVQDAMMRLWTRRDDLDRIDNLRAYCMVTLRHCLTDIIRTCHQTSDADSIPPVSDEAKAVAAIDARSDLELVKSLIGRLPEQQQTVMRLSSFQGLSNEEIASLTGLSNGNVRTLLSRARTSLRNMMKNINS